MTNRHLLLFDLVTASVVVGISLLAGPLYLLALLAPLAFAGFTIRENLKSHNPERLNALEDKFWRDKELRSPCEAVGHAYDFDPDVCDWCLQKRCFQVKCRTVSLFYGAYNVKGYWVGPGTRLIRNLDKYNDWVVIEVDRDAVLYPAGVNPFSNNEYAKSRSVVAHEILS